MSSANASGVLRAAGDTELMAAVSGGSVEALGELYDRYCDRAYRVARSVCREDGRAQDAVQEAFLTVWRSSGGYRPQRGTVAAWLLTVVRNRAIDLARSNQRHDLRRSADEPQDTERAPDDPCRRAIERDDAQRLRASLAELPEAQQAVIMLAFFGQLTHAEIATQLGLPPGTVKGRMRLGMHKLRTTVELMAD